MSLLKYIKSKFCRVLLGILKVTQGNKSETWEYVPLQDFTDKSDIDWNKSIKEIDMQLYQKYDLSQEEIDRGKGQVKGGLVLGLEETSARMTRFGKTELTTGEHLSVSEVLSKVAAVDKDQIGELGESMLSHPLSVTGVGPFENDEALRGALAA